MDKKVIVSILIMLILVSSTVFGMNMNEEKKAQVQDTKINTIDTIIVPNIIDKIKLTKYVQEKANFNDIDAGFLIDTCQEKGLDLFVVLAIIRVESNFDPLIVGSSGEIGLGQIMDDTAKMTAKHLHIDYKRDYLYNVRYNLNILTEHLKYLKSKYDDDTHKILTAYNRGRGGLTKYMAKRADCERPQESSYSTKVVMYYNKYNEEFNSNNQISLK